jgi:uncharacterized DUF497 family protein
VTFEWDEAKSAKNKIKHGISFEEVVFAVEQDGLIAVTSNPAYHGQELLVFRAKGNIYVTAGESRGGKFRLITAQRRRKMEKRYGL